MYAQMCVSAVDWTTRIA